MKTVLAALLVALPLAAFAAPPTPPTPPPTPPRAEHPPTPPTPPPPPERLERTSRLSRVVGLAEELELTTAEALKLDEVMRKSDERRKPLREQVTESAKTLERAADGDAEALKQVDTAAQRIYEARVQLAALDKELYQALSQGLKPQQKAKMAVYFARYDNANAERRIVIRKRMMGGEEPPGGMGPVGPGGKVQLQMRTIRVPQGPGGEQEHDIELDGN